MYFEEREIRNKTEICDYVSYFLINGKCNQF